MAYALVGTLATPIQGSVSAAVTPSYGQTPTAGNLLICFLADTGSSTLPTTPSGWTIAAQSGSANTAVSTIYYRIAVGGDGAPTIAIAGGSTHSAQLAEFSGNSATPLDKAGVANSVSSPVTATLSAADTASGELLLVCGADFRTAARSPNDTWTSNHATITQAGSNNGASNANHYSFGYALATTSNAGADTAVMTASVTTSLSGVSAAAATFLLAPLLPLPELLTTPLTPPRMGL